MKYEVYEVPGKPIPLARHRHVGKIVYDPQSAVKKAVRHTFRETFKDVIVIDEPIKLVLNYLMKIPRSYSNKKAKDLLHKPHSIKPDLSNLVKFTEDVFNDIIWRDDSLVCEISATKVWSLTGMTSIGVISGIFGSEWSGSE